MDNGNWLTFAQEGAFRDALLQAYGLDGLDDIMRFRLGKPREIYAVGTSGKAIYARVVNTANMEEWGDKLLAAALAENPNSRPLLAFARSVGYVTASSSLEKVIRRDGGFQDFSTFITALATIEAAVCQVAVPGGGGTGTLVGPDLVLTNHHVIAPLIDGTGAAERVAQTHCVFDFKRLGKTGRFVDPGVMVPLAADWLVAAQPPSDKDVHPELGEPEPDELDFALIRLASDVGNAPLGTGNASPTAKLRGWVGLDDPAPPPDKGGSLFIAQHPQLPGSPSQEPLLVAWGQALEARPTRLRHDVDTEHGSSGSLCFNSQLHPVALHHLGDPNSDPTAKPAYNQAILLNPIIALLARAGVTLPAWTGNP